MIDGRIKESEYCKELAGYIEEAYKDPDIDPDRMMGYLLAALNRDQVIDCDRVFHFYAEGMKRLNKEK